MAAEHEIERRSRRHPLHRRRPQRPSAQGRHPARRAHAPARRSPSSSGRRTSSAPNKLLARAIATDRVPSMILWGPPGRRARRRSARVVADADAARASCRSARCSAASPSCARSSREAKERSRYARRAHDRLRRRDPPLQQGAAGRVPAARRGRHHHAHRRDDREPVVRGERARSSRAARCSAWSRSARRTLVDAARARARRRGARARRKARSRPTTTRSRRSRALAPRRRAPRAHDARDRGGLRRRRGASRITRDAVAAVARATQDAPLRQGAARSTTTSSAPSSSRCAARDPDAAVYWMMRMLEAGDDPLFVLRRMVVFASEDVGNADPRALVVVDAADAAVPAHGDARGHSTRSPTRRSTWRARRSRTRCNVGVARAQGARRRARRAARAEEAPQRGDAADEGRGLRRGVQVRARLRGRRSSPARRTCPTSSRASVLYEPTERGEEKRMGERLAFLRAAAHPPDAPPEPKDE